MGAYFQQDRRALSDRRSGKDRRKLVSLQFSGLERRCHGERRDGFERRRWVRLFLRIGCMPRSPLIEHQAGYRRR